MVGEGLSRLQGLCLNANLFGSVGEVVVRRLQVLWSGCLLALGRRLGRLHDLQANFARHLGLQVGLSAGSAQELRQQPVHPADSHPLPALQLRKYRALADQLQIVLLD